MSFCCKFLYSSTRNKLILIIDQYYFNVLQTGKLRQYFIDATQVATLALRCKIMQHNSGGTVQYWQQTQFQILVNLRKQYIQIFLVKMLVEVLITLTQKINEDYDEDTGDQNGKPSTLPYPIPYTQRIIITSITFCQPLSMHHLQSTFTKVKKENPQLGSNPDYSATVFQFY